MGTEQRRELAHGAKVGLDRAAFTLDGGMAVSCRISLARISEAPAVPTLIIGQSEAGDVEFLQDTHTL